MDDVPQLSIELLWEDNDLEQLGISANNVRSRGTAKVYFAQGDVQRFVDAIRGFPKTVSQQELFSGGSEETNPFAKLVFHCTDGSGHPVVDVTLGETAIHPGRSPTRNRVEFELAFEPCAHYPIVPACASGTGTRLVSAYGTGSSQSHSSSG